MHVDPGTVAGVELRRLGPADLPAMDGLLDLFGEAFDDQETYSGDRPSPAYMGRLLGDETFIALVALEGGRVVGGLAAYELRKFERERGEIYIYDLAVAADRRRRGIAKALIARVQELAAERGAWVVFVQADRGIEDEAAIALYSGLGTREEVLHFDLPPRPRPPSGS